MGDSINYEVNGYSDWQVIGKDEYAGTIDVVSKTNTEDLTLEPNQTKEYYENKFQETANKYVDNNYAINARTVKMEDLRYFEYNNEFWINEIDNTKIKSNFSEWDSKTENYKIYVIPSVEVRNQNYQNFNIGDSYEFSKNGIDDWVVGIIQNNHLRLIPREPIEIEIEDANTNIGTKAWNVIGTLYGTDDYGHEITDGNRNFMDLSGAKEALPLAIPDFFSRQESRIWIYETTYVPGKYNYYEDYIYAENKLCYENGEIKRTSGIIWDNRSKILGYRPVVTLKIKDKPEEKEVSNKLKVGDNVKYEAKGYNNWKALSIDEDLGTVDIISGGIVKNLTLSGKEDWDNYENIIQREVDEYKNDNRAIKATTVTSSHLKTLKEIDKSTLSRYWILSKNTMVKQTVSVDNKNADLIYYYIGVINLYKNDNFDKYISNIAIYADFKGNQGTVEYYNNDGYYTNEINQSSYTAGLRPVITLKLDSIEKLPEEETKKIEESTEKQEKIFIKEQETKNKDYKGPSKIDDSTSSTGNNNEVKSNDNDSTKKDNITENNTSKVEKIVYKDKPSTRYQLIIQYIIIVLQLGVIIYLLLKKKK